MQFQALTPMLRTRDLQKTIDFYVDNFGFTCRARNDDWGWASLARDQVAIMLATPNEHMPFDQPSFTGSIYIRVDDVVALWAKVKDRVIVCYPIEDFEYGMREFAVFDNNGYLIQFGQELRRGHR